MVEQPPRMEGRQMFMILAPNAKVAQRARDLARQHLASASASKKQTQSKESSPRPVVVKAGEEIPAERQQVAAPVSSGSE